MPGGLTSVFGDPDDFRAALRAEGVVELLPIERGQFQARLTDVALHRLRLAFGEERLARIAFVTVPAGRVLVALTPGGGPAPVWGGIEARAGDVVTIAGGERLHGLTRGPSRWATLQLAETDLVAYGRSLAGNSFVVQPGIARWRPEPAAGRQLFELHRAAIRQAQSRSAALADAGAAHGLEQQLLHAVIECLSGDSGDADREMPADRRHRAILARLEELLADGSPERVAELAAALGVSDRLLRQCCAAHLGMSPSAYRRRRRMQDVHRALCRGDGGASSVADLAARHGFRDAGRFAGRYRAIYGELPSTTRRRSGKDVLAVGLSMRE
jgi:AraC-like DNA-binding protein